MIGILIAGMVASVAGAAEPVKLHIHLEGPDGPLVKFPLMVDYFPTSVKAPEPQGWTDAQGNVTFNLDRDWGGWVDVRDAWDAFKPSYEATEAEKAERAAFFELRQRITLPPAWHFELPENAENVEKTLTVAKAVKAQLQLDSTTDLRIKVEGFWTTGGFGICREDTEQRKLSVGCVPANRDVIGYVSLSFGSRSFVQAVRVPIQATAVDLDLGEIHVPMPQYSASIDVEVDRYTTPMPHRALAGTRMPGITLVSSDASVIISTSLNVKTMKASVSVPPGTYYYLPNGMAADDFQTILIEKLAAGIDLSGQFAHVTVAEGETKTLHVNDVDTVNVIYALPGAEK